MIRATRIVGDGAHARNLRGIIIAAGWGNPLLCPDDADVPTYQDFQEGCGDVILGVGNKPVVGDSGLQKRADVFYKFHYCLTSFFAPNARTKIFKPAGACVQVLSGAYIGPNSEVGVNVLINTGAIIEHDCFIGNHCHIAPGVILCGAVKVGDLTHVGAGSVVRQGVSIGRNCVIGAGSVVVDDVPDNTTVMGNPARVVTT